MWHVWLLADLVISVLSFLLCQHALSMVRTLASGETQGLSGVSRNETHSTLTMRNEGVWSHSRCLTLVASTAAWLASTVALAYGLGWSIVDCRLSSNHGDKYAMTLFDPNVASSYAEKVPEDIEVIPKGWFLSCTPPGLAHPQKCKIL